MATTGLLFDTINPEPVRPMADTSLDAYAHICLTLQEREVQAFLTLCNYLEGTGHKDATGGELADWSGVSVLSLRPRLTGLSKKGWVTEQPARASRSEWERSCHPYIPAVPKSAITRINQRKDSKS